MAVAKKPTKPVTRKPKPPREVELKPIEGPAGLRWTPPIGLDAVIGQERAVSALRAAVASGRVHHAWVFHGPMGVGKFTTALAFAAMILDPTTGPGRGGQIGPDPDSPTQRLLRAGTHPDLHIVTKELAAVSRETRVRDSKQRNIAKDVLIEFLIEPAERTQVAGETAMASKVFIVDEAELMDDGGQNTMLKTLEEPAPGSVIILVTSKYERILPTVRSRCQPVAFGPLSEPEMARWLKEAKVDVSSLSPAARQWLMAFADGSPGVAKAALETGLVGWFEALAPQLSELDAGRFPLDLGATIAKLIDEWAEAAVKRSGSETASKDAANKAAGRWMIRLLSVHFRSRLRHAAGKSGEAAEHAAAAVDLVHEAERQFEAGVQGVFVFDDLTSRLVSGVYQA